MKKLKLQKVLLAICLALPITITTSNGINAMKTNELLNRKNSNYNGPKQTTNLEKTFSQQLKEFIERINNNNIDINELEQKDYIEPLSNYIGNNIIKHLALMIQANYDQIPQITTLNGTQVSIAPTLYAILKKDPLKTLGKPNLTNKPDIKTDRPTNIQKAKFHQYLRYIRKKGEGRTNEEEILDLIANAHEGRTTNDLLNQLSKTISNYISDKETTVDESYSKLIILLGPVAEQLDRENFYQNPDKEDTPLAQLAKLVRQFRDAYVTKLNKQQQEQQQLRQLIANTSTHTQALQLYVERKNITQLGEEEYKKFLLCYIGNNPGKYLALLLQANYDLIPFPPDIPIANQLDSNAIYDILSEQYVELLDASNFCDEEEQLVKVIRIINNFSRNNNKAPGHTTHAAKAILILFMQIQQVVTTNDKITALQYEIEQYISQGQQNKGELTNLLLSILEEIATQLKNDAEAFDDKTQKEQLERLKDIAQLVSKFIEAYNNNNLNNSIPNIKVKGIFDEDDDVNEPNILNQTINGELIENWDDVLAKNWYGNEAENRDDNISNYSQGEQGANNWEKEEIEGIEEGEEIEENKLNNSTPNIKVKGIFDEDDDVNEPNTLNQTINVKLKENWDDVLAKNWYGNEAEDRDDNISNYSQGEPEANIDAEGNCEEINYDNLDAKSQSEESLHLSKDNEGTGKDLNADTNTEHNPQTNNANNEHKKNSITTEGKQDPNTIKVEEDPTAANEQANAPQEAKTNSKIPGNNAGHDTENTENNLNNTKKAGDEPNQLKEEKERAEKIEQLKEEVNAYFNKNKETDSNLTTTQKIINNLSVTNKMLQIIMQILY